MGLVILPTSEIVRNNKTYDHFFNFLDTGIREVIEGAALVQSRHLRAAQALLSREECEAASFHGGSGTKRLGSLLLNAVLTKFIETETVHSGKAHLDPDQTVKLGTIESIVESIEEEMSDMVKHVFHTGNTNITLGSFPWLGDDLMVVANECEFV